MDRTRKDGDDDERRVAEPRNSKESNRTIWKRVILEHFRAAPANSIQKLNSGNTLDRDLVDQALARVTRAIDQIGRVQLHRRARSIAEARARAAASRNQRPVARACNSANPRA